MVWTQTRSRVCTAALRQRGLSPPHHHHHPSKNRKNVRLMQHGSAGGAQIPNRCPPQHPLLKARKHFCIYDIPSSASPPQNLFIFCLARGIFPSLLSARSPAHRQRVNGTNPSQIISEEPARPPPSFSGGRLCMEAI